MPEESSDRRRGQAHLQGRDRRRRISTAAAERPEAADRSQPRRDGQIPAAHGEALSHRETGVQLSRTRGGGRDVLAGSTERDAMSLRGVRRETRCPCGEYGEKWGDVDDIRTRYFEPARSARSR